MAEGGREKGRKGRPYERFGGWASHVNVADSDSGPSGRKHAFINRYPVASTTFLRSSLGDECNLNV